jgi:hypothetical protein
LPFSRGAVATRIHPQPLLLRKVVPYNIRHFLGNAPQLTAAFMKRGFMQLTLNDFRKIIRSQKYIDFGTFLDPQRSRIADLQTIVEFASHTIASFSYSHYRTSNNENQYQLKAAVNVAVSGRPMSESLASGAVGRSLSCHLGNSTFTSHFPHLPGSTDKMQLT